MDPLQFAYQKKRSVDDAILHVLNNIYSHLDKPGSSIRLMFYDFSSAFNTIQPHILVDKLMLSDMHASTVLWILSYLTNRPQYVKLSGTVRSDVIFTSTGAPQGTVLSPFFFSVYTADCRSSHTNGQVCWRYGADRTDYWRWWLTLPLGNWQFCTMVWEKLPWTACR